MQKRPKRFDLRTITVLLAGLLCVNATEHRPVITVGAFSKTAHGSPFSDGWQPVTFRKTAPTEYTLIEMNGTRVVQATSNNAASGVSKEIRVDPAMYPLLQWRWQVANTLAAGNLFSKKGDDFAARIFVTFDYAPANLPLRDQVKYRTLKLLGYKGLPVRALSYVWANKAQAGTVANNAHTSWVKMIVMRSTEATLNQWYTEERNLYEDYLSVFGEPPPAITSISFMTDTDNTGESATAYFGDIHLLDAQ